MRVGFIQNVRCERVVVVGKVSFVFVRVGFVQKLRCEVRGCGGKGEFSMCELVLSKI